MTPRTLTLLLSLLTACHTDKEPAGPGVDSDPQDSGRQDSDPEDTDAPEPVDEDGDGFPVETDCDDGDEDVHPAAEEVCDGIDNDCDGETDPDDSRDAGTWYRDADADDYGDPDDTRVQCDPPRGYVPDADDCDDRAAGVNPGEDEVCDEADTDEDCDGLADEADDSVTDAMLVYRDADGDRTGSATDTALACGRVEGYIDDATDCDDTDASINVRATEQCDTVDNDCDGTIDEDDAADASTWYADADADSYGDLSSPRTACAVPPGYTDDTRDCDDGDANAFPGATDTWYDGADSDCAEDSDYDADQDGVDADAWGGLDCDDTDAGIHPSATETCDEVDQDCDGVVDDADVADMTTWYRDVDKDGYGSAKFTTNDCTQPTGYVGNDDDCDDGDASVAPGGVETWYDGVDGDCDGASDYDADADGWDSEDHDGLDCDDADASWYPGGGVWSVPGDFASIQDAIDGACIYDTIEVAAGTYTENLDVGDKAVVLRGAGSDHTILDGDGAGTVLMADGADGLELVGLTLTGGLASSGAGGFYGVGMGALRLEDVAVTDNEATAGVAGISLSLDTMDLVVDGLQVEGNTACTTLSACRGGMVITHSTGSGTANLSNLTFTDNASQNCSGIYFASEGGTVSIDAAVFEGNTATSSHTAYFSATDNATLTLRDLVVTDNTAARWAGVSLYSQYATATLDQIEATDNAAEYYGVVGIEADDYSDVSVSDLSLTQSLASMALYLSLSTLSEVGLSTVRVSDNTSQGTSDTATINVELGSRVSLSIEDLTVARNVSSYDVGGMRVDGLNTSSLSIRDAIFEDNTGEEAGALFVETQTVTLDGVVAQNNIAEDYALYLDFGEGGVTDLDVFGNTASYALYTDITPEHDMIFANLRVWDNSAAGWYSYVFIYYLYHVDMMNATVVGNGGDGILSDTLHNASWVTYTNVLSAYNGGYGLSSSGTGPPNVEYSDVYNNDSGAYDGMTSPTGADGNLEVDPAFVAFSDAGDPALWDLHLGPGSPLIDAGSASVSDADGSTSDIGAYAGAYDDYTYYADADADGLYDGWETAYGLDTGSDDAADDGDGDGLTNEEELDHGTDPGTSDTDGDGRSDYSELSAGSDPLDDDDP